MRHAIILAAIIGGSFTPACDDADFPERTELDSETDALVDIDDADGDHGGITDDGSFGPMPSVADVAEATFGCTIRTGKDFCAKICDTISSTCYAHAGEHYDCKVCTPAGCVTESGYPSCPF